MKNITTHEGVLRIIRREPSSLNGNPRFLLQIAGFTCYTAPNSSLGYSVQNHDGKRVSARIGTYRNRPTLIDLERAKEC